jgi:hypothetical protein
MNVLLSLRHLYPSIREQRRVEEENLALLRFFLADDYVAPPAKPLNTLNYTQKNFFSILFLAIYRAVGIAPERRHFYGILNHAIRGIVTATDNLLDDEYKEVLPLRFAPGATRFKSVMHILLFDRFLYRAADAAVRDGLIGEAQRDLLLQGIFAALVPIGAEEGSEEGGVRHILAPEEIISGVHLHKGGNLLRLAFVAPRQVEQEAAPAIAQADMGVFRIGMALQVIDDLTDFYEDLRDRRHNYLLSAIVHEGTAAERMRCDALLAGKGERPPVEEAYVASVSRVMGRAVGEALCGFELLAEAGFWLDRRKAMELIRYLFKLRGVGRLLALLPAELSSLSDHALLRRAAI